MKKFIIIAVLGISCSAETAEERALAEYAQSIGDTKTDLNFKLINMENVGEVKASDSVHHYMKQLDMSIENPYSALDTLKKRVAERAEIIAEIEKEGYTGEYMTELYNRIKPQQPTLVKITSSLEKLLADTTAVLYHRLKCQYSIENPFLNNTRQEITGVFQYDARQMKILGREDD